MTGFVHILLTALALVLVIEGLLYALFPDLIRRMMAQALGMPVQTLRFFGLAVAATGFGLVWIFSIFQ